MLKYVQIKRNNDVNSEPDGFEKDNGSWCNIKVTTKDLD